MAFTAITTKLGSSQVRKYFPDIVYEEQDNLHNKDNVWLTVYRALLNAERLKGSSSGRVQILTADDHIVTPEEGSDYKLEDFVYDDSLFKSMRYGAFFDFYDNTDVEPVEVIKKFDGNYKNLGWVSLDDVATYIDHAGQVAVYQNPTKYGAIVIGPTSKKIQILHMAASAITRLLPWFFKTLPLTVEEKDMLRSLYEQDDKKFIQLADRAYDSFDFYGKELAETLKGFCTSGITDKIHQSQNRIDSWQRDINQYLEAIRTRQKGIEEERIKVMVLRNKNSKKEEENELVEFLKANSALTILKREGGCLYVGVNCYLNDFDEDMFNTYVKDNDDMAGYVYDLSPYSVEDTKRLFLAIWEERRFNLRVYCEWKINSDGLASPVGDCNMGRRADLKEDRIPQPHIDSFTCVGNYATTFSNLASERNYIGVLNTIIASSSCITWDDSTVVESLMDNLFSNYNDRRCLEDNEGNLYTVREVMELLKEEKKVA